MLLWALKKFFLAYFHHWASDIAPNFPPQTLLSASLLRAPSLDCPQDNIHLPPVQRTVNPRGKAETLGRLWLATTLPFCWLCDLSLPRHSTPPVILSLLRPNAVENFLISFTSIYTFSKMKRGHLGQDILWSKQIPVYPTMEQEHPLIPGPPSQVRSTWLLGLGARIEIFCFLLYPEYEILLSTFRKNACLAIVFLGSNSETVNILIGRYHSDCLLHIHNSNHSNNVRSFKIQTMEGLERGLS